MINRAKMPRQLRNKGGITNVVPREKYGLGSKLKERFRKLIPNELADVAVKAAPFVAPFNPAIAGLMRGIGRFDQRGSLSDAFKQGLGTYAGGQLFRTIGGAGAQKGFGTPGDRFTSPLSADRTTAVKDLFTKKDPLAEEMSEVSLSPSTKGTEGTGLNIRKSIKDATGLFKDTPILKDLPSLVKQQILVGGVSGALTYIYQAFLAEEPPQQEGETYEEYMARRKENVGRKMKGYFDNYFKFDKEYSSMTDEQKQAFIDRVNVRDGGRIGYQTGGITMANTLAENIKRNLANQAAFQQAINPSKQKIIERLQARQQEPSMMSQVFSGPAFDKYSAERTRAYTESPSRLQYNLDSNKAAGQFIQDKSKEILGNNILGKGAGILATAASVPLAAAITPFHEAAQVVAEGRIKPVSEYSGDVANFTKAFLDEKPLLTAAQRAGGVLQSIPFVGDIVEKAGEKTFDLVQGAKDLLTPSEAAAAEPVMVADSSLITPEPQNQTFTPDSEGFAAYAGIVPGFKARKRSDGRFEYKAPDGSIYGPDTYTMIAAGNYPDIFDPRANVAKGGMPVGIMRTNKAGVMERDYRDKGGFVPVGIKEKADDVPAMLSKNEFVFTADAVRGAGNGSIEKGAQRMYDTMKKLEKRVV